MSVIYKHVERLEFLAAQRKDAPNAAVSLQIKEQYDELKKQVDADIDPLLKLCHPWTYVAPSSIS